MKVLVGIKRVIDYAVKVRVKPDGTGVEINNIKHSMNPFDEIAIEEAVRMKESKKISEITALSIGPKQSQEVLRTALALGADNAIHITTNDRIDQDIYPLLVAKVFKKFVERDQYKMVILGKQSIDDDFNQTGQMLAGLLRWPIGTFASQISLNGEIIECTREVDGGLQTVQFKLPSVLTCDLRLNQPRFATLPNIMKAKKKPIEEITLESLGISTRKHIETVKTEAPPVRQGGKILESVDELIDKLKNEAKII